LVTEQQALAHGNKVAQVTLAFWIIKIAATTLGETGGDVLSMTLGLGYLASTAAFFGLFLVMLTLQVRARRFHPFLYWAVIIATTMTGTTLSDFLDRSAGLGYIKGALVLFAALIAILALWRTTTGSVAVNDIRSPRVEIFYWLTILVSNTLGTAFGDYLADDAGLGYLAGAGVVFAAIAVVALLYLFTKLPRTLLFWAAFVLTRPLGATVGDFLTKSHDKGGLDLGTIAASGVLAVFLLVMIAFTSRPKRGLEPAAG
jgi:uncharacterized membrane-anchored protein